MILYRYIIREHILPFLYSLAVIIFILLMQLAVQLLDKIISKGLDPRVVMELFLVQLGWIIALAVPMAILTATLMAFGQMSSYNEITAIKASGRNLFDLLVPVTVSSIVIAVLLVYFNNRILPDANHRLANLSSDISRKRPAAFIEPGVLIKDFTNYALYVNKVDPRTGWLRGVKIFSDVPGEDPASTVADSGHVCFTADGRFLQLTLFSGESHTLSGKNAEHVVARFDKQVIIIRNVDSQFRRTESSYRGDREKSTEMMMADIEAARTRRADRMREHHAAVDSMLACVARLDTMKAPAIARDSASGDAASLGAGARSAASSKVARTHRPARQSPAALPHSGRAPPADPLARRAAAAFVGPPPPPGFARSDTAAAPADPFAAWVARVDANRGAALDYLRRLEQQASRTARQIRNEDLEINQYLVEVHKKYAIPVTCLVFVLIGAPLGIMARRGGMAVGATYSIFFFILFWACYIGGETLADRLIVPAWIAMWSGNILVGIGGALLIARMVRERSVISFEPLANLWHAVTHRGTQNRGRVGAVRRAARLAARLPFFVLRPFVRTLPLYLIRTFVGYVIGVLLALIVIFTVVDYISNLKGKFVGVPIQQVALYYWHYLPWLVTTFFPIVILLATMFAVGSMARHGELTAMKGAGIGLRQLSLPLLGLGLLLSAGSFYYGEKVLPSSNAQRKDIEDLIREKRTVARQGTAGGGAAEFRRNFYYFGKGSAVYFFQEFWTGPPRTKNVWRQRFEENRIVQRIQAQAMEWDGATWRFVKGTVRDFHGDTCTVSAFDTLADTSLHAPPQDMAARIKVREEMSYWELNDHIAKLRAQGEKVSSYMADLHFKIALPLMNFIVVLLGLSITARAGRKGGAVLFGVGLAIVFSYWIISRFALAFAQSGQIGPISGAWFGNALFLTLGLFLYRRAVR